MDDVPQIGSPVMVRDLAGEVYASRIESRGPGAFTGVLTVAKPVGIPAARPHPVGAPLEVLYTGPFGVRVIPVELAATRVEGRVLLWDLSRVGASWVEQRREFVRVPTFGRMTIRPLDDVPLDGVRLDDVPRREPELQGYLVDLSEAAVQCAVWRAGGSLDLSQDTRVVTEFTVRGDLFTRAGSVHGLRSGPADVDTLAIIRFDQTDSEATALRRVVFATQVDMRATWRRMRDSGDPRR